MTVVVNAVPLSKQAGISDMMTLNHNLNCNLGSKGVVYRKDEHADAFVYVVTPGYIAAMGIGLREGRDFSWSDRADGQHVVIINDAAAKRLWPGEDPLGRIAETDGEDKTVVGVVSNVRETSVEDSSGPEIYVPMTQAGPVGAELVVRTKLPQIGRAHV